MLETKSCEKDPLVFFYTNWVVAARYHRPMVIGRLPNFLLGEVLKDMIYPQLLIQNRKQTMFCVKIVVLSF